MKISFYAVIALAAIPFAGFADDKGPDKNKQPQLNAAVFKIDVAQKTLRVVPWDSEAGKWKKDAVKTISWQDTTQVVSGDTTLTMDQLLAGKPLDKNVKTAAELEGEQCAFQLDKVGDKEVVKKMELMEMFKGQTLGGQVGFVDGKLQFIAAPHSKIKFDKDVK